MDRLRLRRAVVKAMNTRYDAERALQTARREEAPNVDALSSAVWRARSEALKAKRAFDKHVTEHRCSG